MHTLIKMSILSMALAALDACNAKDPSQPKPVIPQTGGVIPQAQLDALNKAKNVEKVLQDSAQQQREQSEQAGQ